MKIKNILKDPDLDERNERLLMIIIIVLLLSLD